MKKHFFIIFLILGINSVGLAEPLTDADIEKIITLESKNIFGDQKENLFQNASLLRAAIPMFLESGRKIENNSNHVVFIEGCRINSCIEKGMVAIDEEKKHLNGVALINYNCHINPIEKYSPNDKDQAKINYCDKDPNIKIIIIRRKDFSSLKEAVIFKKLKEWGAKNNVQRENSIVWEAK